MRTLTLHLTKHEIWSIDTPEVQQKLSLTLSNYLKETTNTALADVDLRITAVPCGVPGQTLLKYAGTIDREDLTQILTTIETYCSKVNPS